MKKLGSILVAFLLVFSLVGTNVFAVENVIGENQSVLNVVSLKEELQKGFEVGAEINLRDYLTNPEEDVEELIKSVTAVHAKVEGLTIVFDKEGTATFTVTYFTGYEESFETEVNNVQGNDVEEDDADEVGADEEDNQVIDNGIEGFNTEALRADLAEGVRQGTVIDVLDYYDQDSGLSVISKGDALTTTYFPSQILFFRVGEVAFTVTDGEKSEDFNTTVLYYPVTGLTFDKTEATIGVGESVDILIDFVPEDGWDDAFLTEDEYGNITLGEGLNLSIEYEGTSYVFLSRMFNDAGDFVGVTLRGVTAGTGELVAYVTDESGNIDENYNPAVATINVGSGQVDPMDATPVVDTTAKGEAPSTVNTADSTLLNVYVTTGMLSLAALTIMYTKKRNINSK